ncbi:hypothetical protein F511_30990 [Dorcoceras hygrometricum]|uniref:Uncharacterized protein n=1 Tax=Dorcoceras hygrometricum TaxID=472368 RepID=A0A2Z7A4K9_9LAMI|nr:hypothetical protein F511_30990 [Dorcoceras hygrometricum]
MASSFIANAHQVNFESVLDSDDENVEEQESVKDTVAVAVEESTVVKHTDEVDVIIGQVLEETSKLATDEAEQREQHLDEPETETVDKTEDSKEVAVAKTPEKAVGSNQTDEELMSIDDLLMQISDNMMLPSVSAAEVTKIRLGSSIEINEVHDSDWYYASLPRISTHDKGKEPLEEDEPVKGNPAREMVELICGDVEFLVQLRDQVMQDVVEFFHSFSLNKLSDLESLRDLKEKENMILYWAEASSLETAVRRRMYILAKYREMLLRKFLDSHRKYYTPGQPWTAMASQIIDLLSVAHSKIPENLLAQQKEHGLIMDRPISSQLFKYFADSSGSVLAQFYSLAKSTCWVRPMILVDGIWTPLQGNDLAMTIGGVAAGYLFFRWEIQLQAFHDQRLDNQLQAYLHLLNQSQATVFCKPVDKKIQTQEKQAKCRNSTSRQRIQTQRTNIRGGDAKKGEGSSSRPQPPPDDQGGGSGGGGSGRTTDIVDRFSGSMSREDQGKGRSGERRSSGNRSGNSNRRHMSDERMDLGPS